LDSNVKVQESLADAKVSARQQCVYQGPSEEIFNKATIYDCLLRVNSNPYYLGYRLRDIIASGG